MQSLTCSLLAAAVALHALFGCCWSHTHDAPSCAAVEHEHDHALHTHHDHGHHHHHHPAAPGDSAPCDDHQPCESKCVSLPVAKTMVDRLIFAGQTLAAIVSVVDVYAIAPSPAGLALEHPRPSPPVRLHLCYQILLI